MSDRLRELRNSLTNRNVVNAGQRLRLAEEDAQRTVRQQQSTCSHKSSAEAPHASKHDTTYLPQRICLACGLVEVGWTAQVLKQEGAVTLAVSREDLAMMKPVYGYTLQGDALIALTRQELTLEQLINGEPCPEYTDPYA